MKLKIDFKQLGRDIIFLVICGILIGIAGGIAVFMYDYFFNKTAY